VVEARRDDSRGPQRAGTATVRRLAASRSDAPRSLPYADDVLIRRPTARPLLSALCVAAGGGLVALAFGWPHWTDHDLGVSTPPLAGEWDPRLGPGTAVAVSVAVAVVTIGPTLARRLSWPVLLLWTWGAATTWTIALATVDGRGGIADLFADQSSFLYDASQVTSWREVFPDFIDRIPLTADDNWQIHVSSHPPGALLAFIGFDRIGLDDTFWLGLTVLAIGTTAAIACCVALRQLAGEDWARRATPWLILAPGAIWVGVTPDALFAAVAAWAITLLALAAIYRGRRATAYAVAAGLAFGCCLYLSYGLVLLAPLALAVLLAAHRWRPIPWVLGGITLIVGAVTLAGFAWWDAYPVLVDRYQAGLARIRPYDYWVWADLAAWSLTLGIAVYAALPIAAHTMVAGTGGRTAETGREEHPRPTEGKAHANTRGTPSGSYTNPRPDSRGVALLGFGAIICVLIATLSGMSKSEVERIWLPFTWWALTLAALLPTRTHRPLLAAQAAGALLLQHLLMTPW
jgi:methylthioxylose transferase